MPLAEAINSAIERCVDLVTLHYHEMAKRAKDVGSAVVFKYFYLCNNLVYCNILYFVNKLSRKLPLD